MGAEERVSSRLVRRGFDRDSGVAGEDGHGLGGPAELGDDLGDVDALAAGVAPQLGDAVDRVEGEAGDVDGLVEGGVERDGVDHGILLGRGDDGFSLSRTWGLGVGGRVGG